jgi:hypothetical protein
MSVFPSRRTQTTNSQQPSNPTFVGLQSADEQGLLVAQGFHRVEAAGAPGGDVAGSAGDEC